MLLTLKVSNLKVYRPDKSQLTFSFLTAELAALACCAAMVFSVCRRAGLAPLGAADDDDEDILEPNCALALDVVELLSALLRIFKDQSC